MTFDKTNLYKKTIKITTVGGLHYAFTLLQ